jgi:hypothetical protein
VTLLSLDFNLSPHLFSNDGSTASACTMPCRSVYALSGLAPTTSQCIRFRFSEGWTTRSLAIEFLPSGRRATCAGIACRTHHRVSSKAITITGCTQPAVYPMSHILDCRAGWTRLKPGRRSQTVLMSTRKVAIHSRIPYPQPRSTRFALFYGAGWYFSKFVSGTKPEQPSLFLEIWGL